MDERYQSVFDFVQGIHFYKIILTNYVGKYISKKSYQYQSFCLNPLGINTWPVTDKGPWKWPAKLSTGGKFFKAVVNIYIKNKQLYWDPCYLLFKDTSNKSVVNSVVFPNTLNASWRCISPYLVGFHKCFWSVFRKLLHYPLIRKIVSLKLIIVGSSNCLLSNISSNRQLRYLLYKWPNFYAW